MAQVRTITIAPVAVEKQESPSQMAQPVAWIVRLDGEEFTHGNVHALPFDSPEDAAQFVADLALEYGPDAYLEIIGLDELGVPLPPMQTNPFDGSVTEEDWQSELLLLEPRIRCERDRILHLVCKALFSEGNAEEKRELIVGLWQNTLLPKQLAVLRRLDAAFVVAKLKHALPVEFVEFAEFEAAFRRWKRTYQN